MLIFANPNPAESVNRCCKAANEPQAANVLALLLSALEHPEGYDVTERMGELFVAVKPTVTAEQPSLLSGGN